jgi:uncharacterized membrane protein
VSKAAGAASGAAAGAMTDVGVDDNFMKEVGAHLEEGKVALFVLFTSATADKEFGLTFPNLRRARVRCG